MRYCSIISIIALVLTTSSAAAQVNPNPINAMQKPSQHAWDLFLLVNHPARDPRSGRGEYDPSKKIGAEGLTVWETWKLARTEVFLDKGCRPPPWSDTSLDITLTASAVGRKSFDLPKPTVFRALLAGATPSEAVDRFAVNRILKADIPDGLFGVGGGETRMNRATFEFIVNNPFKYELYNVEGQEAFYEDLAAGKAKPLSFPVDAMEVKAMWTPLSDEERRAGREKRYHLSTGQDGKEYKLVSLHILTKDVPKWFWATFRQVDGPTPEIPSVDNFGRPTILNGTKWEFYELSGTQTDFTDEIGRPILLSDPHIEDGFQNSSCITCHALASIGRRRPATAGGMPPPNNINFAIPLGLPLGMPVGTPNPNWFFEPRGFRDAIMHRDYAQLDFLWSLPFRAKRKSQDCPN